MISIQNVVKELDTLKPIPEIALRITTMAENPQSSLSDIAHMILHDPIITANLLKICNSAYFGFLRQIDSVHEALSLLGLRQIVDLVLLKCCAENLRKAQKGYGLHEGELFRQAVSSALITRELAHKKKARGKHLIFTSALLKDIGKVVLDRFIAGSFKKIDDFVKKDGLGFREAEKKMIGIDHAEVGAMLAERWSFSPKMTYIIRNHHPSAESAETDFETLIVYLADTICVMMGIETGGGGPSCRFYESTLRRLNLSEGDIHEIILTFNKKKQKVEELLAVI